MTDSATCNPGTERQCRNCGATDTRLVRMDDYVMPTPEVYECIDGCRTLETDSDESEVPE